MTLDDIATLESPAERTARLRALRLSGAKPDLRPAPLPIPETPTERAERLLAPSEEERAAFIIDCWGDRESSTYDIARFMCSEFGIAVTEAEVCKVLRRYGEQREAWTRSAP